jgi:hypothetical protein
MLLSACRRFVNEEQVYPSFARGELGEPRRLGRGEARGAGEGFILPYTAAAVVTR